MRTKTRIRSLFNTLIAICLLTALILPGSAMPNPHTIKFTNGEWPPFTSSTLKYKGLLSKIVSEALLRENIQIHYDFLPWARGYAYLFKTDLNYMGSLGYIWSEERNKDVIFSDPIYHGTACFFHLKSNAFSWESIDDLKWLQIGTTIGYSYSPEFDKAREEGRINCQNVSSDILNFRKLLGGRIDIFPSNVDSGLYLLHQEFPPAQIKRITFHKRPYHTAAFYVIFPRNKPSSYNFVKRFNQGLKKIREDLTYNNIMQMYQRGEFFKTIPMSKN